MKKYEGNMKKYEEIRRNKIPVQVPTIDMSIDELLVARILSKSRSPCIRGESIWRKYEEIWKKYEENMKKYEGNMRIRTLPTYGPWDFEKFRAHPLISEGGGWFTIPRFRGTAEKRHETCQRELAIYNSIKIFFRPHHVRKVHFSDLLDFFFSVFRLKKYLTRPDSHELIFALWTWRQ